jgi:hypothetical protein
MKTRISRICTNLILAVAVSAATLSLMAVLAGCAGTVAPKIVSSSQASWDTTPSGAQKQNSGILGVDAEGWVIVTPHAKDRYNALVRAYGSRFKPGLEVDHDLLPTATNTFLMAPVGFEHFAAMLRWDKQGRSAIPK